MASEDVQVVDKWDVKDMRTNDKAWDERTGAEKGLFVVIQFLKVACMLLLLYIFLLSLSMMGNAFKIIGGPTAGEVFRNSEIFSNPFAGCALGVLATVLVQSSSTSTSIIISMTAAGLMKPQNAMYMIMGANIGTSVTNTIVSMSQVGNKDEYRRAFAGATVHDCFNLLTVSLLLPIEWATSLLYHLGKGTVEAAGISDDQEKGEKVDFIKKLTKPMTSRLISVDKKLVNKVAQETDEEELEKLLKKSMIKNKRTDTNNLFIDTPLSDSGAGWLLLFVSLVLLSVTLILLVKLLQSVFRGRAAIWMQSLLNLEFKAVPGLADYVLVLFGVGITILMQSSSVTTSTLTPLVGVGLIKLDKMFPFTVGANIGTTVTGLLSALAGSNIATGMTVAFGHLYFNLIGTVIWFPIPFMRSIPLTMARGLGSMAADLRWFPLAYIFAVFGFLPLFLFGLSMVHWALLVFVGLPIIGVVLGILCIFGLRANRPHVLPAALKKDASWMPPSMKMEPTEEDQASMAAVVSDNGGSSDLESPNRWWMSPVVYGLGWYVILLLLLATPNAKFADMKYANFDKREHIGLGGWSACSTLFATTVDWADAPYEGVALTEHLEECHGDLISECNGDSSFAEKLGANSVYEKAWAGCGRATTADWEAKCLSIAGCGNGHEEQCKNVSGAVTRAYTIDYSQSGTKWEAPTESEWNGYGYCIPLDELCTDVGGIASGAALGDAGLVFAIIGLGAVLAYCFMGESKDMKMALVAAALALGLGNILLLAGWASVASALGGETTCYVMDDQNDGIVAAKGKLGDIANGGSYSYGLMVAAWLLETIVLGLVGHRVFVDMKNGSSCPESAVSRLQD